MSDHDDHRIDTDAVPSVDRWRVDIETLRQFAKQVPALAWAREKLAAGHDLPPAYRLVVMPDAAPGLFGTLEGYAVEVPGDAPMSDLMFGLHGPGLLSTWILKEGYTSEIIDGLVGVADATIQSLTGAATSFWDLSTTSNPFNRMAERFAVDDEDGGDLATFDISYGLPENSRILLVKHHNHPRDEYRLLIQGGSALADAYMRSRMANKNHKTVEQCVDVSDIALKIVRRHHAMLAHNILQQMAYRVDHPDAADTFHEVLTASRFNSELRGEDNGVLYAVSDTEQVYNCLHHMRGDGDNDNGRFIFYNHCVCMHLSKGGLFLDSGKFFVALVQINREKNASTLTTTASKLPRGDARFLWAFPLAMPYERMLTAEDYAGWGQDGRRQFGVDDVGREDFFTNANVKRVVMTMLDDQVPVDELQFLPASAVYLSSTTGYRRPISRILYDLATLERDDRGYPLFEKGPTVILATQQAYAIHMKAQQEFAKATLGNRMDELPHGPDVHGHDISVILRNRHILLPHKTLVWLYFRAHIQAIVDYYEGRGTLPEEFRKELDAQRTMPIIAFPLQKYIA